MVDAHKGYQERMHLLQKELMGRYYAELTAAAEGSGAKCARAPLRPQPRTTRVAPLV